LVHHWLRNASNANFINSIQDQDPLFSNIDAFNNIFDFHLQNVSPCINTGKSTSVTIDLDGNERDETPDIGCYESKP